MTDTARTRESDSRTALELMATGTNPYKRLAQHDGSDTDDRMFKGMRPERLGEPVR